MTRAPANLLAVRSLLLTYLNVDKSAVRVADLEPAEVGVVGDADHWGGYHCGEDRVVPNDYSVVESSRDRAGLDEWACALDVGEFEVRVAGKAHNLPSFSLWCVAQCKAGAPDTRDIREIIYSPDGETVRRWDRLGRRTTGDSSHLFHTHFSFFRDATKAGRDQTPLFRRYLTTIGLLEDDVSAADVWAETWPGTDGKDYPASSWVRMGNIYAARAWQEAQAGRAELAALRTVVQTLADAVKAGGGSVDTAAILAGVDQRLTALREQVADELATRLAS